VAQGRQPLGDRAPRVHTARPVLRPRHRGQRTPRVDEHAGTYMLASVNARRKLCIEKQLVKCSRLTSHILIGSGKLLPSLCR